MKDSKWWYFLTSLITLLALVVAVPTVAITLRGKDYQMRGINWDDIFPTSGVADFAFNSATSLQGGYRYVFSADLGTIENTSERQEIFNRTKEIVQYRLSRVGYADISLSMRMNEVDQEYQLVITSARELPQAILFELVQPGSVAIWSQDPDAEDLQAALDEDPIFGGRVPLEISNAEIQFVRVVSDSKIYVSDPDNFRAYGLEMVFTATGREVMKPIFEDLFSQRIPLLVTIDGSPVAVQAQGQIIDPLNPPGSLLLFPLSPDEREDTSLLAGIMSAPVLDVPVSFSDQARLEPLFGVGSVDLLKLILVGVLTLLALILFLIKRENSFSLLSLLAMFVIWGVAIMKISRLTLSLPLLGGFLLTLFGLLVYYFTITRKVNSMKRLKTFSKKDINLYLENQIPGFWKFNLSLLLLIIVIMIIQVIPQRGVLALNDFTLSLMLVFYNLALLQFVYGLIVGMLTILLLKAIAFRGMLYSFIND